MTRLADFLEQLWHRRERPGEKPLPTAKVRGPVEHRATQPPFSREARQKRNRAAGLARAMTRSRHRRGCRT